MTETITNMEMDVIGEIANISMGNAATTLSVMVNNKVDITTPYVEIYRGRGRKQCHDLKGTGCKGHDGFDDGWQRKQPSGRG